MNCIRFGTFCKSKLFFRTFLLLFNHSEKVLLRELLKLLQNRESNFNNRTHQRAARDKVTDTGTKYRANLAGKQTVDLSIEGWLSHKDNICIYMMINDYHC